MPHLMKTTLDHCSAATLQGGSSWRFQAGRRLATMIRRLSQTRRRSGYLGGTAGHHTHPGLHGAPFYRPSVTFHVRRRTLRGFGTTGGSVRFERTTMHAQMYHSENSTALFPSLI